MSPSEIPNPFPTLMSWDFKCDRYPPMSLRGHFPSSSCLWFAAFYVANDKSFGDDVDPILVGILTLPCKRIFALHHINSLDHTLGTEHSKFETIASDSPAPVNEILPQAMVYTSDSQITSARSVQEQGRYFGWIFVPPSFRYYEQIRDCLPVVATKACLRCQ